MDSVPVPDFQCPTQSLCPVCLARVPAAYVGRGEAVFLKKTCMAHGSFLTLVWQGPPAFQTWRRPKIPTQPPVTCTNVTQDCPFDCGLCPRHRQRTCSVIVEVTQRCNLHCPVCYAAAGNARIDPDHQTLKGWFQSARHAGGNCNLQISGGEPTLRRDLPEIIAMGRRQGFDFIQLNTNGLRLADRSVDPEALKRAGLSTVFLQFDGTHDAIHQALRGRRLMAQKRAAIEACTQAGLGVVLVPTIVAGINTDNIGDILELALEWFPTVRSVHFQPVSYFGRYPHGLPQGSRVTLPDVIRAIENQTDGRFAADAFRPPCCENALCSFHGQFLIDRDGRPQSLQPPFAPQCCADPIPAEKGAARAIAAVARQWARPQSAARISKMPADKASAGGCCDGPPLPDLDAFLAQANARTFSVSAMAFQDAWSLDLERVRDCCIHVLSPEGRLIPFCLYNLTSSAGKRLYRP